MVALSAESGLRIARTWLIGLAWAALVGLFAGLSPALASERVLLSGSGPKAQASAARLSGLRATAGKSGKVKVIVGLRVPFAPEGRLRAAAARAQRVEIAAATAGIKARFPAAMRRAPKAFRTYDSIPFVAMEVTPQELETLAADPNVLSISENRLLKLFLAESSPLVEADKAWADGYTGLGQTIAIIDTGIDKNHPFLAGKVVSEACYSQLGSCPGGATASTAAGSGMPCANSTCSHGTHVAGIAAGLGSTFSGIARNANLISIQVFSIYNGSVGAYDSDLIAGLERVYALRNDFKIAAVNMSLGGGGSSTFCDASEPALAAAVNNLASAGIATIAASGNNSYTSMISFPACLSTIVSVGAVSDAKWGSCGGQPAQADKVACYSNSAGILTLLAPGSYINSSVPGSQYTNFHGTSMAAPHVAGAWAVIRQKAPSATNAQILSAFQSTGKPVTDYRNGVVKSRINVKAALDSFPGGDVKFNLQYTRLGAGGGAVNFSPAGAFAACSESCTNSFTRGATVTMTAAAAEGSAFQGWSGACTGTGACTVTMSQAISVNASFILNPVEPGTSNVTLQYSKLGTGSGAVTFNPAGTLAACAASCANSYATGTVVTMTAAASAGSSFVGWSGACSGPGVCSVTMSQAASVSASFAIAPNPADEPKLALQYLMVGPGEGSVSFSPAGTVASCSNSCSNSFAAGATVTLTATGSPGSAFLDWSGACSGTGACIVTMSQARTVTARFVAASDMILTYSRLGAGAGNVAVSSSATKLNCGAGCLSSHQANTLVTLRAEPSYGSAFAGWSGACRGLSKTCRVRMKAAASVNAAFNLLPVHAMNLAFAGSGSGSVSMTAPDGVKTCGAACSGSYPAGVRVRLSAKAAPGSVFVGWSGACRDMRTSCAVTMRSARTVTARFRTR